MVMNVLKEKRESYQAEFNTTHGLISFFVASFIEGFLIVEYSDKIYTYLLNWLASFPQFIINYIAYILLSIVLTIIYLIMLYFLIEILKIIGFKNRKIIK